MGKRLKKVRKAIGKRLKKRTKDNKEILRRLDRIEEFLGQDLIEFHKAPHERLEVVAGAS